MYNVRCWANYSQRAGRQATAWRRLFGLLDEKRQLTEHPVRCKRSSANDVFAMSDHGEDHLFGRCSPFLGYFGKCLTVVLFMDRSTQLHSNGGTYSQLPYLQHHPQSSRSVGGASFSWYPVMQFMQTSRTAWKRRKNALLLFSPLAHERLGGHRYATIYNREGIEKTYARIANVYTSRKHRGNAMKARVDCYNMLAKRSFPCTSLLPDLLNKFSMECQRP